MSQPPNLLNDDGSASMATALLLSHHAFRRDIARFAAALARVAEGDTSKLEALREEWQWYRSALHGHHEAEDGGIFPSLKAEHPELASVIEGLSADHRLIDPLLERGDRAFAELPKTDEARAVVQQLAALLDRHLATEEAQVVGFLRSAKDFPVPPSEDMLEAYAKGFGWASHGIAPEVLTALDAMMPAPLRTRLPAARVAFDAKCVQLWGALPQLASRTSVPGQ